MFVISKIDKTISKGLNEEEQGESENEEFEILVILLFNKCFMLLSYKIFIENLF